MAERRAGDAETEFLDRIVGNPIHAYKMMKRFTVDLKKIENDLKEKDLEGKNQLRDSQDCDLIGTTETLGVVQLNPFRS